MSDQNATVDYALQVMRTGEWPVPEPPRLSMAKQAFRCAWCDQPVPDADRAGDREMFCSGACRVAGLRAHESEFRDGLALPGDLYTEGRDPSLAEFVVLHLGCGRKQRLEQLPEIHCYDATGAEVFPPIRLINLDGMTVARAHLTATLGEDAIPLPSDSVDLMIATHVLEHIGRQGELGGWFQFWGEVYRILKPGGRLQFLSPYYTSQWCWGDPTHSRAIGEFTFIYLNQDSYRIPAEQTAIPDYRPPCDLQLARWSLVSDSDERTRQRESRSHIEGVLIARKPFRPYWEDAR